MSDRLSTRRWLWLARTFIFPLLLLSVLLLALPKSAQMEAPADSWWNSAWSYRRKLTITTTGTTILAPGYTARADLNAVDLVDQGKLQADGDDLRVVYWDGDGSVWLELDRWLEDQNIATTTVWFMTPTPIDGSFDNVYLYYGNASAVDPPDDWSAVYAIGDDFDDGTLTSGLSTSASVSTTITETGGVLLIDMTENITNAGIAATPIPSAKDFASEHRITRQTVGLGLLNLSSVVQNAVTPTVAPNSDFNKTQRVLFTQDDDGSIYISYLDDQAIWLYWDGVGVAWVVTPTAAHIGTVGLAYEAIVVSDGLQVSFSLRDQDGELLAETQPVPWAQIADNDKGDPFWLLWGEPYTNRDYMDVASDWFWLRLYESPEPAVTVGPEETSATITIAKTPDEQTVLPGSDVTFTISLTGANAVSLTDVNVTDLLAPDCDRTWADLPADTVLWYTCTLPALTDDLTNTVSITGLDPVGVLISHSDSAWVDALPEITVTKTANPAQLPEPGGTVSFTLWVTNTSGEAVTITSLTDDVHGDLAGQGDCDAPQSIPGWGGLGCTFAASISGTAGYQETDAVTVWAADDESNLATAAASATVTVTNVAPSIVVTKTAVPDSVTEPGGLVSFAVQVGNRSVEPVTVTSLVDDPLGDLLTSGECPADRSIALDGVYECIFTAQVSGTAPDVVTDTVTAVVRDDEYSEANASDTASVTITKLYPSIAVTKTAVPLLLPEPGGPVSFTVQIANTGVDTVTVTSLVDDPHGDATALGDCQVGGEIAPAAEYQCSFEVDVSGNAFDVLTDTVTVWAEDTDGDPATASATAAVTLTNIIPSIEVTKTAVPDTLPEPSGLVSFTVQVVNTGLETVTLSSLIDDPLGDPAGWGDCQVGGEIFPNGDYQCTFEAEVIGNAFEIVTDTVTAVAADDDGSQDEAVDEASVSFTNVSPSIAVTKTVEPTSVPEPGGSVEFTVRVANTGVETVTLDSLSDDPLGDLAGWGDCQTGGNIAPGEAYQCAFTVDLIGNATDVLTDTVTAIAYDDEGLEANAADGASVTITNVDPSISVTKLAVPDFMTEPGGWVDFSVRVDNTGPETVTLISLIDDIFGDLDTEGSCAVTQTVAAESHYECTFSREITGTVGFVHTDTVTATVRDDEGNTVPQSDSVAVSILTPGIPDLLFEKDDGLSAVYAGDALTYTLVVSNVGATLATNVVITDTLLDYVQYTGCLPPVGGECGLAVGGTVVYTIPSVAPSTIAIATLQVTVSDPLPAQATTISNHAVLTATYLTEPLSAEDADLIATLPDLVLSVSHEPPIFYPGELMTYTVAYSNTGHMDAENVMISTVLPEDAIYVGGGWQSSDGRNYRYTVGLLEAFQVGLPVDFVVSYPVNDPQEISEPEFVTPFSITGDGGNGGDANPDDNDASGFVGVPDLVVADFYVWPPWVRPNTPITFTVVIENQGTGLAQNVTGGGFWFDVFMEAVPSYPYDYESTIAEIAGVVLPGAQVTATIAHEGFSPEQLDSVVDGFFVKLDNFHEYSDTNEIYTLTYGLVPEYDEMNNVAGPLAFIPDELYDAYLPLIIR